MGSNESKAEKKSEAKNEPAAPEEAEGGVSKSDQQDIEVQRLQETPLGKQIIAEYFDLAKASDVEHQALLELLSQNTTIPAGVVRNLFNAHHTRNIEAVAKIVNDHPSIQPEIYNALQDRKQRMERPISSPMSYSSTPQYGVQSQRTGASYHYCNYYPYPRL